MADRHSEQSVHPSERTTDRIPQPARPRHRTTDDADTVRVLVGVASGPEGALQRIARGRQESGSEEDPSAKNKRQQDKIIGAIQAGRSARDQHERQGEYIRIMGARSIRVEEHDRVAYLNDVAAGRVTDTDYAALLNVVNRPGQLPHVTDMDDQERGIIAELHTGSLGNRTNLEPQQVEQFAATVSVQDFERAKKIFLGKIHATHGAQKRERYERAYDRVGEKIYGKQWEYMQQIQALKAEAQAIERHHTRQVKPIRIQGYRPPEDGQERQVSAAESHQGQAGEIVATQAWLQERTNSLRPKTEVNRDSVTGRERFTNNFIRHQRGVDIEYTEGERRHMTLTSPVDGRNVSYTSGASATDRVAGAARINGINTTNYLTVNTSHYFVDANGNATKLVEIPRTTPREGVPQYAQWEPDLQIAPVTAQEIAFMAKAFDTLRTELSNPVQRLIKSVQRRL